MRRLSAVALAEADLALAASFGWQASKVTSPSRAPKLKAKAVRLTTLSSGLSDGAK
jgi:hypothetical protein